MIIDVNMHWLPETLFTHKRLLRQLVEIVPRGYNEYVSIMNIPGTGKNKL